MLTRLLFLAAAFIAIAPTPARAADLPEVETPGLVRNDWLYDNADLSSDCDCYRIRSGGIFTTASGDNTVTVTLPTQTVTNIQTFVGSPVVYIHVANHNALAGSPMTRGVTISGAGTLNGINLDQTFTNTCQVDDDTFCVNTGTNASGSGTGAASATIQWIHGLIVSDKIIFYMPSATVGGLAMGDAVHTVATVPNNTSFTFEHPDPASSTVSTPTATAIIVHPAWQNEMKLRFVCSAAHLRYDDPIVNPNQPGVAHLHQFWGNDATNAFSDYNSLRTTGHGSCEGGDLNLTGYWQPALVDFVLRKAIKPIWWVIYYQGGSRKSLYDDGLSATPGFTSPVCASDHLAQDGTEVACPVEPLGPLERGLKMIWGFKAGTGKFPDTYCGPGGCDDTTGRNFNWYCSARDGSNQSSDQADFESLSGCPSPGILSVRMGTPTCWDGNHDTDGSYPEGNDHYSHLAFPHNDGNGSFVCPATHPKQINSFTILVAWGYDDWDRVHNDWWLSSDRFNGANYPRGKTYHTDWFGAWDTPTQNQWTKHVQGQWPTPGTFPYIYNSTSGASPLYLLAGGPYVTTTNNGGLGNCSAAGGSELGLTGFCAMKTGDLGNGHVIDVSPRTSEEVDLPSPMQVRLRVRR